MSDRREQLLEIIEDAAKGETKATLRAELAALRAAVPEGEPDYWAVHARTGVHIGLWPDKAGAEEVSRRYEGAFITPLYTHPAPRPDMERELAEARAENLRNRKWAKDAEAAVVAIAAERDALARCVESGKRLANAAYNIHQRGYADAVAIQSLNAAQIEWDAALSGASITAPADKAEARREALEEAARWHDLQSTVAKANAEKFPDGFVRTRVEETVQQHLKYAADIRALISQEQPK